MNNLLIKALITVMVIDAGMHFYYAYKLNKRSDTKWDSKIVRALNAITEEKEKSESNAEESAQSLLHGN